MSDQQNTAETESRSFAAGDSAQCRPGDILEEHYQIISLIGEGGMGFVYRAKNVRNGQIVAIKTLHSRLCQDQQVWLRFQQEAKTAGTLAHPNAITVHDLGITGDGIPYLVMDYLEGQSLADLLQKNPLLAPSRAVPIFIQICAALAHAHQKGVVHRDIKPSNVMLVELDGNSDFVKLVDFGIAKLVSPEGEEDTINITRTGDFVGSPAYMSPEQCRGMTVDARSDVYSLGCVMYQALCGKLPQIGINPLDTINKHIHSMPVSFKEAAPDAHIPKELEAIVFQALAKEPGKRYQTLNQMKEDLEAYQKSQGNLGSDIKATIALARMTNSPLTLGKKLLPYLVGLGCFAILLLYLPRIFDPLTNIDLKAQLPWQRLRMPRNQSEQADAHTRAVKLIALTDAALKKPESVLGGPILQVLMDQADFCADLLLYEDARRLYKEAGNVLFVRMPHRIDLLNQQRERGQNEDEVHVAIGWARCDYELNELGPAKKSFSAYMQPLLKEQDAFKPLFIFQAMCTYGDLLYDEQRFDLAQEQFTKTLRHREVWITRFLGTPRYFLALSKLADTLRIRGGDLLEEKKLEEGTEMLAESERDYVAAKRFWQLSSMSSEQNAALCDFHLAQISAIRDAANAATMYGQAIGAMQRAFGNGSPVVGVAQQEYSAYLSKKGHLLAAVPLRLKAWWLLHDANALKRANFALVRQ